MNSDVAPLRKPIISRKIIVVPILIALSACSTVPQGYEKLPDTANPHQEVAQLEMGVAGQRDRQFHVLAPKSYALAQHKLSKAKESLENQVDYKKTLHIVAEGKAYLGQAQRFGEAAEANLPDVIAARKRAQEAGAEGLETKRFKSADDDLMSATKQIENGRVDRAVAAKKDLLQKYMVVELEAMKKANLNEPQGLIREAKSAGAKEYAPRLLAIAEKSVMDLETFITANRHDHDGVASRADATRKHAQHLLKITKESRTIHEISPEESALRMEAVKNAAQTARHNLAETNEELLKEQSVARDLAGSRAKLEASELLNQRFEAAREVFSPNEAEVYKRGNDLLIRLKGMNFPVDQALLSLDNQNLLAKVEKVISSFGDASVVIEGHTDSSGGKALNQRLSLARAEIVRGFLQNNRSENGRIEMETKGLDFQRPLATNKTAEGRAQNRRVDVIVTAGERRGATVAN